jgi:hypothetical protein
MRASLRPGLTAAAVALAACGAFDEDEAAAPSGGPPPAGFATEIVSAHNAVRAEATPVPDPPLPPLSWSESVTATAQAWTDGCVYQHNPRLRDLSLGENIAATAPPGGRTATEVVGLWASEAPYYDHVTNTCDTSDPPNEAGTCGHYTQLVWRSTTVVGCAMRTCSSGSPFGPSFPTWDYWVCDYAPPGNHVGQRPY